MNNKPIQVIAVNNSTLNILAKTAIDYKGGVAEVMVVGQPQALANLGVNVPLALADVPGLTIPDGWGAEPTGDAARFYSSPLVARTAFEDLAQGAKMLPVFEGRSYSEMQDFLAKNAK